MKLALVIVAFLAVFSKAQSEDTCHAHASETCRGSNEWTDGQTCNAIYGNIDGNKRNLQKLMADHLKQSFQFIVMVSIPILAWWSEVG